MYIVKPHCKKRGVTEHPRGAIFYCFRGNSMGYHGNSKILLSWGVPIHNVFYSAFYPLKAQVFLIAPTGVITILIATLLRSTAVQSCN